MAHDILKLATLTSALSPLTISEFAVKVTRWDLSEHSLSDVNFEHIWMTKQTMISLPFSSKLKLMGPDPTKVTLEDLIYRVHALEAIEKSASNLFDASFWNQLQIAIKVDCLCKKNGWLLQNAENQKIFVLY